MIIDVNFWKVVVKLFIPAFDFGSCFENVGIFRGARCKRKVPIHYLCDNGGLALVCTSAFLQASKRTWVGSTIIGNLLK
jgi:hypothetical protein